MSEASTAAAPRGQGAYLMATALVCGTLVMVVEVLGSRVIGPFFGVSLFVWSSLISVALIALAIGYGIGGILADRAGTPDRLYGIILVAGLLVLAIPLLRQPVLTFCMPLGLRSGAFLSSLILFGPPLTLMGCVSPFVVRLAAREMRRLGRTVGLFYAVSTLGSVAGTLLTGFVLIIHLGVTRIFILAGGVLIALAAGYFLLFRRRWIACALLLIPATALLWPEGPAPAVRLPSGTEARVVFHRESLYGNVKVVDYRYGERHTRELLVDGIIQSGMDVASGQSVYPYTYLLGLLPWGLRPGGENCLVIGLGGGSVPRWYHDRGVKTDAVDIDPTVVRLARDYFGYRGDVAVEDARYFLSRGDKRYDYVVLDVFSGEALPSHVMSVEAFRAMKGRMTEKGILAFNFVGRLRGEGALTPSVVRTLRGVFERVEIWPNFDPSQGEGVGNIAVLAYDGPVGALPGDLAARFPVHPMAAAEVDAYLKWRHEPPDSLEAPVLTDEHNPVDCLDTRVKEFIRRNVLEGTPWEILLSRREELPPSRGVRG